MSKKPLPNKYKLTPTADKACKILAVSLGQFHRKDKNGQLMYREETKFIGQFTVGNKKENRFEKKKVPLMVNHYINLVEIWQKDGQKGIDIYVNFFKELKAEGEKKEVLHGPPAPAAPLSIVK